jgi:ribose 5-phosphate isomerase B
MIVLASDHAGVGLKAEIVRLLEARGEAYHDLGPADAAAVDYPQYAHRLAGGQSSGPDAGAPAATAPTD